MKKDNWIFMPHAGHFIDANSCKFKLNTYVGGYIVSTIGEYWTSIECRKIYAKIYDPKWFLENKHLKGDDFDHAYFKRFGFETIGVNRLYETMVFKAKKSNKKCCPYEIIVSKDVDMQGYNEADKAREGHLKLCNKWSKKR